MNPKFRQSFKNNTQIKFCQMSCTIDTVLEETLSDIDEFIQSELGFAPLIVTEPLTAAEVHDLSSLLQTRESSNGLLLRNTPGEYKIHRYTCSTERWPQLTEVVNAALPFVICYTIATSSYRLVFSIRFFEFKSLNRGFKTDHV